MHIINFKTIDSTNSYIKREYKNINHFTWVISDEQTKGKGRLDNTWTGSKDSLMCSILLKEDINLSKINLYPLIAAQSLHKVLSTYHKDIKIKWPNDLYIHDNYCNTYNYLKDLNITYVDNNQIIDAKAININNQGQLIVKTHNQLIALNSGEVSLKRNKLKH
jgi:BirA family transcriptional regulator, biotin operon repressor / biotin---[acetyl-CoA-carboxylase] ligase